MDEYKIKFLRKLFFYEETVAPFDMEDIFDFVNTSYDLFIDDDGEEQYIAEEEGFRIWIEEDIKEYAEEDEESMILNDLKKWLEEKNLLEWLDKMYVKK
jgi:hypothetical protein